MGGRWGLEVAKSLKGKGRHRDDRVPLDASQCHHKPHLHDTVPIYLPVSPSGSTVGTLNCEDLPVENCPDRGPLVAFTAQSYASANGAGVSTANPHDITPE